MRPSSKLEGKRGGRQSQVQNYSAKDIDTLLNFVERDLPINSDDWQRIGDSYNGEARRTGRSEREWENLRDKFNKIVKQHKPTGSGECPEYVRRAKRLSQDIFQSTKGVDLDDGVEEDASKELEELSVASEVIADTEDESTVQKQKGPSKDVLNVPAKRRRVDQVLHDLTGYLTNDSKSDQSNASTQATLTVTNTLLSSLQTNIQMQAQLQQQGRDQLQQQLQLFISESRQQNQAMMDMQKKFMDYTANLLQQTVQHLASQQQRGAQ